MRKYLVVGLGDTGESVLRFLKKQALDFVAFDTRDTMPGLHDPKQVPWPKIEKLIVSPGVPLNTQVILAAKARKLPIIGDIELFYQAAKAPIIAITGTNAKSTVTTLVTDMINATGRKALMGGNIGIPALDLLDQPVPDFYVLELSSFQLDLLDQFQAFVAVVLNISADHLDRHGTMEAYQRVKERIYQHCPHPIRPNQHGFGVREKLLLKVTELSQGLAGQHNVENALNALAILAPLDLPLAPQLDVLRNFKGLPHRCVLVREREGVKWYNDSKGTNVGATLAAIKGLGVKGSQKLILLLGGVAKEQSFVDLREAIAEYVREVIIYGQDRDAIAKDLQGLPCHVLTGEFIHILNQVKALTKSGDSVLFSPACASLDMFKNFEDRGEQFTRIVEAF